MVTLVSGWSVCGVEQQSEYTTLGQHYILAYCPLLDSTDLDT